MAVLEAILVLPAILAMAGASVLVFLKEKKKGFAFLLMAVGFGLVFLSRFFGIFHKETPDYVRLFHLLGWGLAAFAYLGYLWPRIRDQVRDIVAKIGLKSGAAETAGAVTPPAGAAPAPSAPESAPPPEEAPTVPPVAPKPVKPPPPPLELPPEPDEAPPPPPPPPPP